MEKTTEYAIYYLSDNGNSPTKIAKELNLKLKEVKEFLSNRTPLEENKKRLSSKDLMISETSVKGNKSVSIMTKSASELNDSLRSKLSSSESRTSRDAIYRPNK